MSKEVAEVYTKILRDIVEDSGNHAASKTDFQEVAVRLRTEMNLVALTVIGTLTVITALFGFLAR